ncbi:ELWxxDGT repeat protein [Luteolibacter marinus]|uniref:ELWxxDGT repeat protein n=1 Tax=Luteolibacter marinus TaxID=2776705 RepID=UPI001866E532|nr:ELWxxDGT repeat protein [Luteolibacter marinus]
MMRLLLSAALVFTLPSVTGQSEARLVADLNRAPGDFSAQVNWVTPTANGVVFSKDSIAHGPELWSSDGTAKGTRLLADLIPGTLGSAPELMVASGGRVFFRSHDARYAEQLRVTDGTAEGTRLVMEFPAGGSLLPLLGTADGLFFTYDRIGLEDYIEQWFSDGTPEGTRLLNPLDQAGTTRDFSFPAAHATDGQWCYFLAHPDELWRSDGTTGGTTKLLDFTAATEGWEPRIDVAGERLYLTVRSLNAAPLRCWTCNKNGGDFRELILDSTADNPQVRGVLRAGLLDYVFSTDRTGVNSLWVTDGSSSGTHPLPLGADHQPQTGGVEFQGQLYFASLSETDGQGLWRTDGTAEGTVRVVDAAPGAAGEISQLLPSGETLYFQRRNAKGDWEQWQTKGSPRNTRRTARMHDWDSLSTGPQLAFSRDRLFFTAGRNTATNALWMARAKRGVRRLTVPEKSSASAYRIGRPFEEMPYGAAGGGLVSFVESPGGRELWRITPEGRKRAIWKVPADFSGATIQGSLGTNAIFSVHGTDSAEVWVTNGTARGTRLLSGHQEPTEAIVPTSFVVSGGSMFYSLLPSSDATTEALMATDGTPEGTRKIVTIDGTAPRPLWHQMADQAGTLYFLARSWSGSSPIGLWKSDGSPQGTVLVTDDWGAPGHRPSALTAIGNRLSITVNLPLVQQLWKSDGTAGGTGPVQIYEPGNALREIGPSFNLGGRELLVGKASTIYDTLQWWTSDGTNAGTHRLVPGVDWQHLFPIQNEGVVAGGKLYYSGMSRVEDDLDSELWVTDGTAAGTALLKDIYPGVLSSIPEDFVEYGGSVYFVASDPEHGREVWKSDGTEAGTVLAADIEPGPGSSFPGDLEVIEGRLYFHAQRPATGRELYVIGAD